MKSQKNVNIEKTTDIKIKEPRRMTLDEGEIILLNLDFFWTKRDTTKIIQMWKEGKKFRDIAKHFSKYERTEEEVFLALLHLSMKNKIKKREGFIWGIE